ncbi:hypothetical protein PLICRDRAFT_178320 [Plicaturopsis crispa FD-325 SS-3]|nr:hypothetical protein PLICRDRAFT_178320 [Plicaturopsis crispa FD-325 SS-3]
MLHRPPSPSFSPPPLSPSLTRRTSMNRPRLPAGPRRPGTATPTATHFQFNAAASEQQGRHERQEDHVLHPARSMSSLRSVSSVDNGERYAHSLGGARDEMEVVHEEGQSSNRQWDQASAASQPQPSRLRTANSVQSFHQGLPVSRDEEAHLAYRHEEHDRASLLHRSPTSSSLPRSYEPPAPPFTNTDRPPYEQPPNPYEYQPPPAPESPPPPHEDHTHRPPRFSTLHPRKAEKSVQTTAPTPGLLTIPTRSPSPSTPRSANTVRTISKPVLLTPPPTATFTPPTPPAQFRGLPLDAAHWTLTPRELQHTVSRSIRLSASPAFVRLLPPAVLAEAVPTEAQRLQDVRVRAQARWRWEVQRRTMLMQALLSQAQLLGEEGSVVEGLTTQLAATCAALDAVAFELTETAALDAHLAQVVPQHHASALAIALRKLNTAYGRRTEDLRESQKKVATLEAELSEAWAVAEGLAKEMDGRDAVAQDGAVENVQTVDEVQADVVPAEGTMDATLTSTNTEPADVGEDEEEYDDVEEGEVVKFTAVAMPSGTTAKATLVESPRQAHFAQGSIPTHTEGMASIQALVNADAHSPDLVTANLDARPPSTRTSPKGSPPTLNIDTTHLPSSTAHSPVITLSDDEESPVYVLKSPSKEAVSTSVQDNLRPSEEKRSSSSKLDTKSPISPPPVSPSRSPVSPSLSAVSPRERLPPQRPHLLSVIDTRSPISPATSSPDTPLSKSPKSSASKSASPARSPLSPSTPSEARNVKGSRLSRVSSAKKRSSLVSSASLRLPRWNRETAPPVPQREQDAGPAYPDSHAEPPPYQFSAASEIPSLWMAADTPHAHANRVQSMQPGQLEAYLRGPPQRQSMQPLRRRNSSEDVHPSTASDHAQHSHDTLLQPLRRQRSHESTFRPQTSASADVGVGGEEKRRGSGGSTKWKWEWGSKGGKRGSHSLFRSGGSETSTAMRLAKSALI